MKKRVGCKMIDNILQGRYDKRQLVNLFKWAAPRTRNVIKQIFSALLRTPLGEVDEESIDG